MRAAVSDGTREIGGGKVRAGQVGFEVSRVTSAALVAEEAWDSARLTRCCKAGDTDDAVRYQDLGVCGDEDTYSFAPRRFCTTRM